VTSSAFAFAVANVYGVTRRRFRRGDRRQGTGDRRWRGGVEAGGFFLKDLQGAVGRAVIDDNYLVRDAAELQFEVQVLDGRCNAAFLVTRRDDYRQKAETVVGR
jgi:hypothetical protein